MTVPFSPVVGQVAMVEPQERGRAGQARPCPLIGVIGPRDHEGFVISGVSSPNLADGTEVIVSVIAPQGLYKIRAAAHWELSGGLAIDPIHDVERIQRRRWPRYPIDLRVTVASLENGGTPALGVTGHTLDLGMGGLRIGTGQRLPRGHDVCVDLTLPDTSRLVTRTTVCSAEVSGAGCEYGLAFDYLDQDDTTRLRALVGQQSQQSQQGQRGQIDLN